MPDDTPPKLPTRGLGTRGGLLCPGCNGNGFSERSSFKTASEPLLGAGPATIVVDLMNCTQCGLDFPAVRGRRHYALVGKEKLASLLADLEEAKRIDSEMRGLLDTRLRRSQELTAEVERCRAKGEVSVLEARVSTLESQTESLSERRDRLAKTLQVIAARTPP